MGSHLLLDLGFISIIGTIFWKLRYYLMNRVVYHMVYCISFSSLSTGFSPVNERQRTTGNWSDTSRNHIGQQGKHSRVCSYTQWSFNIISAVLDRFLRSRGCKGTWTKYPLSVFPAGSYSHKIVEGCYL